MKRSGLKWSLLAMASLVLTCQWGCSERASARKSALPTAITKPTPEESLAYILETFQRRVESAPIGFIVSDASGRSMMSGTYKVSHKLVKPANEGEAYKAVITVESQSNYSLRRPKIPTGENTDHDQSSNGRGDAEKKDESGVEVYDPQLVNQSASEDPSTQSSTSPSEEKVSFQQNVHKRDYELVYKDGRWSLTTKLDPKTEQSIQNAFDQALKTQH